MPGDILLCLWVYGCSPASSSVKWLLMIPTGFEQYSALGLGSTGLLLIGFKWSCEVTAAHDSSHYWIRNVSGLAWSLGIHTRTIAHLAHLMRRRRRAFLNNNLQAKTVVYLKTKTNKKKTYNHVATFIKPGSLTFQNKKQMRVKIYRHPPCGGISLSVITFKSTVCPLVLYLEK